MEVFHCLHNGQLDQIIYIIYNIIYVFIWHSNL
jgi:hypothetical protein